MEPTSLAKWSLWLLRKWSSGPPTAAPAVVQSLCTPSPSGHPLRQWRRSQYDISVVGHLSRWSSVIAVSVVWWVQFAALFQMKSVNWIQEWTLWLRMNTF